MTTTYVRGTQTARFATSPVFPSVAEAAVAGALKTQADARLALWVDWAGGVAKPYAAMGAAENPASSKLMDRLGST